MTIASPEEKTNTSFLNRLDSLVRQKLTKKLHKPIEFKDSGSYWEQRYASGGNSGVGSYTKFAEFKAEVLNEFVSTNNTRSVIEFGCGDGNQLELADYPDYSGFDVSETAIEHCRQKFEKNPTRRFFLMDEYEAQQADLSLSLDVIFHLIEDNVYNDYMKSLFAAANRHVIVFASNTDDNTDQQGVHVRHRRFSDWIDSNEPTWKLMQHIPNRYPYQGDYRTGSFADFYIYEAR